MDMFKGVPNIPLAFSGQKAFRGCGLHSMDLSAMADMTQMLACRSRKCVDTNKLTYNIMDLLLKKN
jgi:hypothetical protein